MRVTWFAVLPLVAALTCGDEANPDETTDLEDSAGDDTGDGDGDEDACEHNAYTFAGAFNGDSPWGESSYCDEIYVCADATAAEMLSELGWQCQVHKGPGYCNGEGDLQCILASEVIVTEQHVADTCTALTVPGIIEVFCSKF